MLVCFNFFSTRLRNQPFALTSFSLKTGIAKHHGKHVIFGVAHSLPPENTIFYKSFAFPTFWQNFSSVEFLDVLKFQKTYQAVGILSLIEQLRAIWKMTKYLTPNDFFCKIMPKLPKLIPLGSFRRLLWPFWRLNDAQGRWLTTKKAKKRPDFDETPTLAAKIRSLNKRKFEKSCLWRRDITWEYVYEVLSISFDVNMTKCTFKAKNRKIAYFVQKPPGVKGLNKKKMTSRDPHFWYPGRDPLG